MIQSTRPLVHSWSVFVLLAGFILAISSSVQGVTQYHEQGLRGQESYKYGFDTGDYSNPQQRHEERDGLGNVKGHFTYMDGSGHKVVVYYKADKNGFYRSDDPSNGKAKAAASGGGHYAAGSKHHSAKAHPHHHHHHHHHQHQGNQHHKHHSHLSGPLNLPGPSEEAPVMTPVASDISTSVNAHPGITSTVTPVLSSSKSTGPGTSSGHVVKRMGHRLKQVAQVTQRPVAKGSSSPHPSSFPLEGNE